MGENGFFSAGGIALAERAHPLEPGFQGTAYEQKMHERYQFAARFAAGKDVLDAACGVCWGWIHLREARSITGFDISLDALLEARRLKLGDHCAAAEMRALPFRNAAFDVVVCLEAIEHVAPSDATVFLGECWRVLRPGGMLVLSTPLRQHGRHSGNPWHLAEYDRDELTRLLEPFFEPLEFHVDTQGEAPVFLYAGMRKSEPGPAGVVWGDNPVNRRALEWLLKLATPDGFRFTDGGETTLTSTAIGVLLAEGLGALDRLPQGRHKISARILSAQEEATGLFIDPLFASVPLEGNLHGEQYFHWMNTFFALHALDALGARPRHRLSFLDPFFEPGATWKWLDELDWSNPWRESNRVMQLLSGLLFSLKWDASSRAAEAYHSILDWLDARQDPATGLWGTDRGATLLNAVAGAYHFVPFYRYARRPVRAWSKIVAACLELQQTDGLFGPGPGGGACEDTDAIDLLCTAARIQKRVPPEIRRALTRAFWAILNLQRDDGSFPYANVPGDASYLFSSWPATQARRNGGDVWATWFRLVALHTIRALLGDDLPPLGSWTFRRFPALGFHLRDTAVPAGAEPSHRTIWFRPLAAPPAPARPRVAVVVTCYNLGEYIHEALASLCRQTLKDVETVIIDDGSTDPFTVSRLDALAAEGWRVIRTENRGLPAARNLGIRETGAPYVCCLDADDRLRPAYLEKAAAMLDAEARVGFVSPFYALFDEAAGAYRYTKPRLPEMLARNEAAVCSVFRRQAWLEAGGYCEALPAMQDWDLWIAMLAKGWEGRVLPEILFDYRIREGSMYSNTRKPGNYARIRSLIHARHADLYQKYFADVLRLESLFFAEHVEYCLKLQAALRQESAARRQAEQARALAEEARRRAEEAARAPAAPSAPAALLLPPPSLWRTLRWLWTMLRSPHERKRLLPNLWMFLRVFLNPAWRRLWYRHFCPAEYVAKNPGVGSARIHASVHYAFEGAWQGLDPSEEFSTPLYWLRYRDVAEAGLNPLLHWIAYGRKEGRRPIPHRVGMALWKFPEGLESEGEVSDWPAVSVVIPCFNLGRYVEEALTSVLRQTFRNREILLVEGGSTDGETAARLRRLERAGISGLSVLYRDRPSLAGDNRNFAIRHARGRYICCLDADDQLDPVYLESAVFLAEFGGYDLVYPSVRLFGKGHGYWRVEDPVWPYILRHNQVPTVALFRRQAWEAVGGYRDWGVRENYFPEDWDLWVRMIGAGFRGAALREPLMHYRIREGSLSKDGTGGEEALAARLEQANPDLFRLPRPLPRPHPLPGRFRWSCFEEQERAAALMVIPFFSIGGAERIFAALLEQWRRRGERVLVLTTRLPDRGAPDCTDSLRRLTPHVYPLEGLFPGRLEIQRDFLYFLLRRHRPRLIFTAGSDFFYWALPAVRRFFPAIPIVDQLFNDLVFVGKNRDYSAFIDCTVVPSKSLADKLAKESAEIPGRIAVIPHGADLPDPPAATGTLPPGMDAGFAGKPVIGFFGRLSPEKGALDFVRIAAAVRRRRPEARFVMTGSGPEEAAVREEVRQAGLEDAFLLPGFVDDVHAWMAAASVVAVPSRIDGMPLAILEALALEKPVVASRVGSIPEVVQDGVTGMLCDPGALEAFADALCRLLDRPDLRRRMGAEGRRYVLREHRKEIMVRRYFQLFDRLAGVDGRGAP